MRRWLFLSIICFGILIGNSSPSISAIAATPVLWLPTPPGQIWRVIQGYGCGTHDAWDFYSLDLAAADHPSAGAPVYAAAAGTVLAWVEPSGTLILDHGGGFYTMYTHMASTPRTQRGQALPRGAQVGTVGDRGAPGNPHLHFTAFTADGPWGRGERQSVPLRFAEGYNLGNIGGCDQHNGAELVSRNQPVRELAYSAYFPLAQSNTGSVEPQPTAPIIAPLRPTAPAIAPPRPASRAPLPRRWRAQVFGL